MTTDRAAPDTSHRRLARLAAALPSGGDVTLIALLGFVLGIPPYDTDVWWHLKTGEWILAHHAVPRVDFFSFTAAGQPWIAHEWLAEVGLALAWRLAGVDALIVVTALLLVATLAVLYRHVSALGLPVYLAAPLLAGVLILMLPAARPRPYLLSLVALAVLALLLRADERRRRRALLLVPALFALWANVHGGFVFGLAWLALTAAGAAWDERRVPRREGGLLALAVAGVLCNPNGARLLLYPFQYRTGSVHYRLIVEWASADFHEAFTWLVEGMLLVALALIAVRRPRGWRTDLLHVLAFGQLALVSVRNIPVLAVVAAPIVARGLVASLPARWRVTADEALLPDAPAPTLARRLAQKLRTLLVLDRRLQGMTWLAVAAAFVVASTALDARSPKAWEPMFASATADLEFPYAAGAYLARDAFEGNVLNDYGWGGYLIWRLWPQRRVFIDGRADVYGETVLEDYARMIDLAPGWDALLDAYAIRHVLLRPDVPLTEALRRGCGWHVAFEDEISVLLSRPAGAVCP